MTATSPQTNIKRLKHYADAQGLHVRIIVATQREPDWVVQILDGRACLIQRTSRDSAENAAWYLVNALSRLGVEVPDA